jgi:ribosomal protein S18 acetylase RimI-like enzyme
VVEESFAMAVTYVKRYKMETLLSAPPPKSELPKGFHWVPWKESLLETHANVKYLSFRGEMDANIFPCFRDYLGCYRLMRGIRSKPGFLPQATWLIVHGSPQEGLEHCATIQGVRIEGTFGSIQNVGVIAKYRRRGLAHSLVKQALRGFYAAGIRRVMLEVTAENTTAINIYKRIGFEIKKSLYKETYCT